MFIFKRKYLLTCGEQNGADDEDDVPDPERGPVHDLLLQDLVRLRQLLGNKRQVELVVGHGSGTEYSRSAVLLISKKNKKLLNIFSAMFCTSVLLDWHSIMAGFFSLQRVPKTSEVGSRIATGQQGSIPVPPRRVFVRMKAPLHDYRGRGSKTTFSYWMGGGGEDTGNYCDGGSSPPSHGSW